MKLPQIQYRTTPTAQAQGPNVAVAEYSQKQNLLQQAFKASQDITEAFRERDLSRADNAYAEEMAQFRMEASQLSGLSPGQVVALDLDIDTEGRDEIRKDEWYPMLLAKRMEEYRGKHAASIRSPVDRKKWEQSVERLDTKILEQEIGRSANQAIEFELTERTIRADEAYNDGNYDLAQSYYEGPEWKTTPSRRAAQAAGKAKIFLGMKTNQFTEAMLSANSVEDYDAVLAMATNPEWNEGLAPTTVLSMANSIITQRNASIAAAKTQETDTQNDVATATLVGITEGTLSLQDVNERAFQLGKENHARLVNAARTQSTTGVISDPSTMRSMTMSIMDLRAGFYEGDFGDRVRDLQRQLGEAMSSIDPETGGIVNMISMQEASKLSVELAQIKDFPYKTGEYTALINELNDRILGTPENALGGLYTDESRSIRANAVNSLRNYVEENGGVSADLEVWRKQYMPGFLSDAAKASFLGLPQDVQDTVVYNQNNYVDHAQTMTAFESRLEEALLKIDAGDKRGGQALLDRVKREQSDYLKWYDNSGAYQNGN